MAIGILVQKRVSNSEWSNYLIFHIHRYLALLAVIFLSLHIITAIIDPFAGLKIQDAILPFVSKYRTFWLGLGVLAVDLLLAVALTSWVRKWVGTKWWRLIHYLAYGCWPLALLHGMGTGSDTRTIWGLGIEAICLVAVVIAVSWRLWEAQKKWLLRGIGIPVLGGLCVWSMVWAINGPLNPGWAVAAGTPSNLLSGGNSTKLTSTSSPSSTLKSVIPLGLNDQVVGVSGLTNGGLNELTFSDGATPAIGITLVQNNGTGSTLLFEVYWKGAVACQGAVDGNGNPIGINCNGVNVSITLKNSDDSNQLVGILTTGSQSK
jgi:DMSO/TMAO reductase YedYZ heme-binding membrane subunit